MRGGSWWVSSPFDFASGREHPHDMSNALTRSLRPRVVGERRRDEPPTRTCGASMLRPLGPTRTVDRFRCGLRPGSRTIASAELARMAMGPLILCHASFSPSYARASPAAFPQTGISPVPPSAGDASPMPGRTVYPRGPACGPKPTARLRRVRADPGPSRYGQLRRPRGPRRDGASGGTAQGSGRWVVGGGA